MVILFIKSRLIVLAPVSVQLLLARIVRNEPGLIAEIEFFGFLVLEEVVSRPIRCFPGVDGNYESSTTKIKRIYVLCYLASVICKEHFILAGC